MAQILNVAPILFENATISVEKLPFSKELFDQLHITHRKTHLVKRAADSILLVPLLPDLPSYGGDNIEIDLKENLSLASSLARGAMFRELSRLDCWLYDIKPISYLIMRKDLLEKSLSSNIDYIQGLSVFEKWEIDFRVIDPLSSGAFVSMSVNISTAPRVTIGCASLLSKGFPIAGYYVGIPNMAKNPDLKPRFMTVGRVSRVLDSGLVELADTREGYPNEMDPIELFVEPREEILESCIRFFYKDQAELILGKLAERVSEYHLGNQKLQKLKAGLQNFQRLNLKLAENIPFKIGDFLSDTAPSQPSMKVLTAEKPTFVFSPGGAHTSQFNDPGLQKYGPYSKEYFTPSKPRICVICQLQKKGQVEVVVRKFLNGIPPVSYGKGGSTFEFTGLKTKFYLQDCVTEIFTATDGGVDAYNKAVTAALQSGANGKTWDLALVQIDRGFRELVGDKNPYLVTKARFIAQGVPVQEFTMEALGLPDQKTVWSLNGMALATYAKLGGSPWLLTADKPIAHELVFGIGSAMVQNSRLGHKERMIGITTVFTGDGNYFINSISAAVQSDQYLDTLLNSLRRTMDQVRQSLNWQPNDTVRLIFHAFKTFKDAEAEAVKQVVTELGSYRVEFAFIHIAASHPYVLFDTSQQGVGFYHKGVYAPERGQYLQISEHVSLVCLTGPRELKQASDGLPQPIQLVLHRDSTFKDVTYLSRQVVKFGAHSWRSYLPAPMPVTVYYSQLVAQMISQLSRVSIWNSDTLFNKIGNTRWFL